MRELHGCDPQALGDTLLQSTEPMVLRGLVARWPAVQAAVASEQGAEQYVRRFYQDASVVAFLGAPAIDGRFFYNEDLSGFNFAPIRARLDAILDEIAEHRHDARPPSVYVGSTTIETCLPGFCEENPINLGARDALASVWIGNRTRIAAHYDVPDNLAGQPMSLVDFKQPDLQRFPQFSEAQKHAHVADLGPGDAIFIPSMWWHHVEALDSFNVLVNYWWRQSPDYMDTPTNTLMLALMSMRDLPSAQRAAWQEIFRHYVFEADGTTCAHIAPEARRLLAPLNDDSARSLRAQLIKKMNR